MTGLAKRSSFVNPNSGTLAAAELLFDAMKVMVPVVTGFATFFVGGAAKVWSNCSQGTRRWAAVTVVLALLSLGMWSGVMPFVIMTVRGIPDPLLTHLGFETIEDTFSAARLCARVGHLSFFASVVAAVVFFGRVAAKQEPAEISSAGPDTATPIPEKKQS